MRRRPRRRASSPGEGGSGAAGGTAEGGAERVVIAAHPAGRPLIRLSQAALSTITGMSSPPGGSQVVLVDGGMSNELEARGHDLSDALWSARLLRDAPQEIAAVHRTYFAAGAAVATTASYQASVDGFVRAGVEPAEARRLLASSVSLAREVRDELADDGYGGGWRRRSAPTVRSWPTARSTAAATGCPTARLRDFHLPRLELLAAAEPDLLAVETIPDADEAAVLVAALDGLGVPAWLSFTVDGDRTRAGQPLGEAFAVAAGVSAVVAVGRQLLCARRRGLRPVAAALHRDRQARRGLSEPRPSWDGRSARGTGPEPTTPVTARAWVDAGATYVGGCCQVGAADITALAAALR
jgi:homocysteine S-methyltransferase